MQKRKKRRPGWLVVGQSWEWIIELVMGVEAWRNRMMSLLWLEFSEPHTYTTIYGGEERHMNDCLSQCIYLSMYTFTIYKICLQDNWNVTSKMTSSLPQAFRHIVWYDLIAQKGILYSPLPAELYHSPCEHSLSPEKSTTTPEPRWSSNTPTDRHIRALFLTEYGPPKEWHKASDRQHSSGSQGKENAYYVL